MLMPNISFDFSSSFLKKIYFRFNVSCIHIFMTVLNDYNGNYDINNSRFALKNSLCFKKFFNSISKYVIL